MSEVASEAIWPAAKTADLRSTYRMSTERSTVNQSDGTTRSIDSDRYVRAVVEDMTVTRLAPSAYEVRHDGETYAVGLESVHCTCPDHEYRGARCKHLVRAALFAAFTEGVRTRFTAAVVRAADDYGCADGYHACDGPTGDTYPCPTCVAGTSTGDWTVWCVAVDGRPAREVTPDASVDRGTGAVTDGGESVMKDETRRKFRQHYQRAKESEQGRTGREVRADGVDRGDGIATDGGRDRPIENVVKNLGGYGIRAEVLSGGKIKVAERSTATVNCRLRGFEWLDEQGFERDEAATRERDDHWAVFSR